MLQNLNKTSNVKHSLEYLLSLNILTMYIAPPNSSIPVIVGETTNTYICNSWLVPPSTTLVPLASTLPQPFIPKATKICQLLWLAIFFLRLSLHSDRFAIRSNNLAWHKEFFFFYFSINIYSKPWTDDIPLVQEKLGLGNKLR